MDAEEKRAKGFNQQMDDLGPYESSGSFGGIASI